MCEAKWLFSALLIVVIVEGCHLISTGSRNGTSEILWKITARALYGGNPETLSRQYIYPPYNPGLVLPPATQGFTEALASIAANDDLQCIPRLLCELTSGSTSSNSRQTSFLPININMESLLRLLSGLPGGEASPVLLFGRAALLGYTSNGNSRQCEYSFPRCPTNPDQLVNYLNNHKGGFFRYFNGVPGYRPQYYGQRKYESEQRIQTKKLLLSATSSELKGQRMRIKFPADDDYDSYKVKQPFYRYKSLRTLAFPEDKSGSPQTLSFPVSGEGVNNLLFFPTRTGTGELILDTDTFDHNHRAHNSISFN